MANTELNSTDKLDLDNKLECASITSFQFILLPVVYSVVCCLGLMENFFYLWNLLTKKYTTVYQNPFMVSLAAMDLLFALSLPLLIVYHAKGNDWIFGEVLCKISMSLYLSNIYGSPLILTCISLERYISVVHPVRNIQLGKSTYKIILSCCIWAGIIIIILGLTCTGKLTNAFQNNKTACMENFSGSEFTDRIGIISMFASFVGFVVPYFVLITCYSLMICKLRTLLGESPATLNIKKKSTRTILIVMTVLTVCFLPYHTIQIVNYFSFLKNPNDSETMHTFCISYRIALAAASFNSCLDPVVYYYQTTGFKLRMSNRHFQAVFSVATNFN
ncbi:lysophosphatidic acid receptor 6-like [Huso huso]|uniref:Lysophosphatidic acid receptor 6-like n=1 Tax=Huso huso TaxID=61971 RepID=A0ABR0YQ23_HUSHU